MLPTVQGGVATATRGIAWRAASVSIALFLRAIAAPVLGASAVGGCEGSLLDGPAGPIDAPPRTDARCTEDRCVELPAPSSRFPRLSHDQYENTVRDLLGLGERPGITQTYLGDATSTTFDNNGAELSVGEALWGDYQRGAEALAERATASPEALARIVPAEAMGDPRAWVEWFGLRAHRRPLTTEQVDAYVALHALGAEAYPGMDPFAAGVRIVLEAMLQSPHFLYRMELSNVRDGDVIALDDWEIASRLSYALWDTMPDEELFRAARAGELRSEEGIRAQAMRMLMDRRAEGTILSFHRQLLRTDAYRDVSRSTTLFPEFDEGLRESMVNETHAFVRYVIFEENGGLARLLTAPFSFVDARLARVYGISGDFGDVPERTELDPTRRAGLLTQIGFLAVNATATEPDAIHRGVFVNHRILCAALPPPPMMVPPLPPDETGTMTMRERIDRHTGPGTCGASCHGTMINPIGFAFEHYDALGRWRDQDRGRPVDASGTYDFGGERMSYDGAVELANVIADTAMAHGCYVRHWVEYAYGRAVGPEDRALIARVAGRSLEEDLSVRDILVELVASQAFRTRSVRELED